MNGRGALQDLQAGGQHVRVACLTPAFEVLAGVLRARELGTLPKAHLGMGVPELWAGWQAGRRAQLDSHRYMQSRNLNLPRWVKL